LEFAYCPLKIARILDELCLDLTKKWPVGGMFVMVAQLRLRRSRAMSQSAGVKWVGGFGGGGGGLVRGREKSVWSRMVWEEMGKWPTEPRGVHARELGLGGRKKPWK
jgi:hypothetical protein